ncbi:hypothetical protein J4450_08390 [Candidatus Micrarchaeota archaeon]|nr:hypothetical protein [Candidatus Micrarchaeota archaeon]
MLRIKYRHRRYPTSESPRAELLAMLRRRSTPDPKQAETRKPSGIDISGSEWKRYLVAPDVPRVKDLPKITEQKKPPKDKIADNILTSIQRIWSEAWSRINVAQNESIVNALGRLERELADLEDHYSNEITEADAVQLATKIKELLDAIRERNTDFPSLLFSELIAWNDLENRRRILEKQIAEKLETLTQLETDLNTRTVESQDLITSAVDADRSRYWISSRAVFDTLQWYRKLGAGWKYLQLRLGNGPFGRYARKAIFSSKGLASTYEPEFERERAIYEKLLAEHGQVVEAARAYTSISDELRSWQDVNYYWAKLERKSTRLKDDDNKILQRCFLKVKNLSGEGSEGKCEIKQRLNLLIRAVSEYRDIQEKKMRIMRNAEGIAVAYNLDRAVRPATDSVISEEINEIEDEARKIRKQTHSLRAARVELQISDLIAWSRSCDDICATLVRMQDSGTSERLRMDVYLLLELAAIGKELGNGFGPATLERLRSIIYSNSLNIQSPNDLESAAHALEDIKRRFNIPKRVDVFDRLADADGLPVSDRALVRWHQACLGVPETFKGLEIPRGTELIRWKNSMQEHTFYGFYAMVNEWIDNSRIEIGNALLTSRMERKLEDHVYKHVHGTLFEGSGEFGRNGSVITIREEVRVLEAMRRNSSSMLYEPRLKAEYDHRLKNARCMEPFENGDLERDMKFYLYATLLATEQGYPFVRIHHLKREGYTIPELIFLLPLNDNYVLCTIYYADTLDWSTTFITKWPILAEKSQFLAPLRESVFSSR